MYVGVRHNKSLHYVKAPASGCSAAKNHIAELGIWLTLFPPPMDESQNPSPTGRQNVCTCAIIVGFHPLGRYVRASPPHQKKTKAKKPPPALINEGREKEDFHNLLVVPVPGATRISSLGGAWKLLN